MKATKNNITILYFCNDGEIKATESSLIFVKKVLKKLKFNFKVISLKKEIWLSQIASLNINRYYLIISHGGISEDGTLHSVLEKLSLFHTGHPFATMAVLTNKYFTKLIYCALNIPTPNFYYTGIPYNIMESISIEKDIEYVKKPITGGSKDFIKKVKVIDTNKTFIYERFISGSLEVSVYIIGKQDNLLVLDPIVRPRALFRVQSNGNKITQKQKKCCIQYAQQIHKSFNCCGLTKTDMLIDQYGQVWVIETDALPGIGQNNAIIKACEQSNISPEKLINLLLKLK